MSDGRVKVTGKPSKYFSLTDDNISQITMTPSLVKASSTMPETDEVQVRRHQGCLLYTSPSPRDRQKSRMPSSA